MSEPTTSPKKVIVASANPVKIAAALAGLQRMFPQETFVAKGVSVPSGVADQPMTDAETRQGALNRVKHAQQQYPAADFWLGLEGGVEEMQGSLASFAWIVVAAGQKLGQARTGTFFLPQVVTDLVRQGMELGVANDQVFSKVNSKQKGGAIGLLSHNALDRKELYTQAVLLALVPFKNEELYF